MTTAPPGAGGNGPSARVRDAVLRSITSGPLPAARSAAATRAVAAAVALAAELREGSPALEPAAAAPLRTSLDRIASV